MSVEPRRQHDEGRGRRVALLAAAILTAVAIALVAWSVVSSRAPARLRNSISNRRPACCSLPYCS